MIFQLTWNNTLISGVLQMPVVEFSGILRADCHDIGTLKLTMVGVFFCSLLFVLLFVNILGCISKCNILIHSFSLHNDTNSILFIYRGFVSESGMVKKLLSVIPLQISLVISQTFTVYFKIILTSYLSQIVKKVKVFIVIKSVLSHYIHLVIIDLFMILNSPIQEICFSFYVGCQYLKEIFFISLGSL